MRLSLLNEVYRNAGVVDSGRYATTVNEFTDQLPALRPAVLQEAARAVSEVAPSAFTKVVVEEDKGVPLGAAVSLNTGVPLAVAREYTYELPSHRVDYASEYKDGALYLNGVVAGDRALIVDDTISTGGVLVALIGAVRELGAEVAGVVAVVDKVQNGGVARVLKETGVEIQTLLPIEIVDGRVVVVEDAIDASA
jgi:adenine phosphoribosyltransferase